MVGGCQLGLARRGEEGNSTTITVTKQNKNLRVFCFDLLAERPTQYQMRVGQQMLQNLKDY